MPAQKLTKARLAQIIIMLTILVAAFIWRSLSYQPVKTIDCSQKSRCELTLEGEKITFYRINGQIQIQTDKMDTFKIDLDQDVTLKFVSNLTITDMKELEQNIRIFNKKNELVAIIIL
ncbi:hypothetical protein LZU85_14240 [Vibrio sp. IRLE0018]|uniref:hypothetical protein n=1 Tax=Vibrio floridensis TaxID=2908007 RepID=UPI001A1E34D3|nr:hypothetical protein [Vibrio floridensis]MCF8779962.1 hypothetical protein [Vibrio floridensis]HAS6349416.1 hypothetical protein [Vibrio vulnificus]